MDMKFLLSVTPCVELITALTDKVRHVAGDNFEAWKHAPKKIARENHRFSDGRDPLFSFKKESNGISLRDRVRH